MSKQNKQTIDHYRTFINGLALFSMFFGSGNLIFPLAVGKVAQSGFTAAALGFTLTAVLIPFLGVIAMLLFDGNYHLFFSKLGKKQSFAVILTLLSFWIPLGSGPRCITLSYANTQSLLNNMPLWLFGFIYSVVVYVITMSKSRMMDILGYFLTPSLLLILSIIIFSGISAHHGFPATSSNTNWFTFKTGLLEGYYTMDLIASFFFSATIINLLRSQNSAKQSNTRAQKHSVLWSCLIGMSLLSLVYLGLLFIAASNSTLLMGDKEQLLSELSTLLLPPTLRSTAAIGTTIACVTTSVALSSVYADFLHQSIFRKRLPHHVSLAVSCLLIWLVSTQGFSFISYITEPSFQILYPLLILFICYRLVEKRRQL